MTADRSVELSADGSRAFVTTRRAGTSLVTTKITDAITGADVGQPVTVNENHSGIRYSDDGSRLYVFESLGNSSKITVIDTATGQAGDPLFVDGCNPRLSFSADTSRAIVTTSGCDEHDDLSRLAFIDTETGRLLAAHADQVNGPWL